ncbi:uncharacterized protein LOC126769533 isoform X2 [Nymphalis io]|uniref:uncharacterized protein LOC126769533 isoform X2 n=1 Tax=Inachis io TaxID=171585 RepID=UPI0021677A2B|nr:uncharacterized protein LOC126769533 isoform X2 [Nymphalis io]
MYIMNKHAILIIVLFLIISIIILIMCSVSNVVVNPMEGTMIFLTKDINVKPSPVLTFASTMENINAAAVQVPNTEIRATQPVQILPTDLVPPVNVASNNHALGSHTIEPTPKLAPMILTDEKVLTLQPVHAIAPTQVVKTVTTKSYEELLRDLIANKQ